MTDIDALVAKIMRHVREDTIGDDDPIIHRTVVDQDGKPIGSEQIVLSRVLTSEAFTDENGTAWTAPTGYAYAKVCKARDALSDEIAVLKEASFAMLQLVHRADFPATFNRLAALTDKAGS